MNKKPTFDLAAAHKYFSAECFNNAWDLIDKKGRTAEEDEQMLRLSLASTWHWSQREDCTQANLAIGYWQTSRIYALLDQVDNARRYGQLSLDACQEDQPFLLGYAYEALARAESLAGNNQKITDYLQKARDLAEKVPEADDKKLLLNDLDTIH
jgi:hypothetical protein